MHHKMLKFVKKQIIMKKAIFTAISTFTLLLIISCSGSGPGLNTICTDTKYNGLTLNSGNILFNVNSSPNLNTSTFISMASIASPFSAVGNVKGTYDKINDRYVFLGENDNTMRYILVESVTTTPVMTANSLAGATNTISGNSEFSGAVFNNGRLFVVELDSTANTFWISEIDPNTGANLGVIFTDSISNFLPTNVDSFGIRYYADTDRADKIYFLGKDKLLEIDFVSTVQQYYNLPNSFAYFDIEVDMNGFLLSAQIDTAGVTNLVQWDLSGGAPVINETVLIPSININSESISLVYKGCDQILHLLNHSINNTSTSNTTTISEYDLSTNLLVTSRTFTGDFIFGYSHIEL